MRALKQSKVSNLLVEKLVREASDNFFYLRDYDSALQQVDNVLKIEEANIKALILKGDILFCMDKDMDALNFFDKAIDADPHSAEAYGSKAGTLDVLGKHSEALFFCDKAFKYVNKKDKYLLVSLYDQKITLLLRLRRYEEAQQTLKIAKRALGDEDYNYLSSCYKSMIDTSCKIRKKKLQKAQNLSLKVV